MSDRHFETLIDKANKLRDAYIAAKRAEGEHWKKTHELWKQLEALADLLMLRKDTKTLHQWAEVRLEIEKHERTKPTVNTDDLGREWDRWKQAAFEAILDRFDFKWTVQNDEVNP